MRYLGGGIGHCIPYREHRDPSDEPEEEDEMFDMDDSAQNQIHQSASGTDDEDPSDGEVNELDMEDGVGGLEFDGDLGPEDGEDEMYEEWETSDV